MKVLNYNFERATPEEILNKLNEAIKHKGFVLEEGILPINESKDINESYEKIFKVCNNYNINADDIFFKIRPVNNCA